jgi:hypothetical protein
LAGLEEGVINSSVSKPFVVAAVVFVFVGSAIGSVWMMIILGVMPPVDAPFMMHRMFQVDGFLTIMIMGIGYMIVPRFRNTSLPSNVLAYVSLALVLTSLAVASVYAIAGNDLIMAGADALVLAGVCVFASNVLWMLRIRPRLLGLADYFIALSVITLVAMNLLRVIWPAPANALAEIQAWLLFPVLMIFGIEYKTMPSFLGFIRPKKSLAKISLVLAAGAITLNLAVIIENIPIIAAASSVALLSSAALFAISLYIFGGFSNSEIVRLISGEKKARYTYTTFYTRIAFGFLYTGIVFAILFYSVDGPVFLFYDLAIHCVAIGFVGATIALYLPLMLPPILGKHVRFTKLGHMPIILIAVSLAIRFIADLFIGRSGPPVSYILMTSGWFVVAGLFVFVFTLHQSMKAQGKG